jgi:hypothetical protein
MAAALAVLVAFTTTSRAQVTFQQITNGLVDYYPLTTVDYFGVTTPDLVNLRDMTLYGMGRTNIVAGSHPGIESNYVMNFSQSGGPTVIYYQSTGQNPLDGSGDFLPFINQRNATMNFWIKGNLPAGTDQRIMAECAQNGEMGPFFSLSDQPAPYLSSDGNRRLGYFIRENTTTNDPNGVTVNLMPDGTFQTPSFYYFSSQTSQYTSSNIFDGNWHMMTTVIGANGDIHCFVDGGYDPGNQSPATTDNEGNPAIVPPIAVTNTYYVTNTYPFSNPPTNNPPPGGYVHWMIPSLNVAGAATAFGGYYRNGSIAGGPPIQLSDIGYWNRTLSQAEIQFVMTNGLAGVTRNTNFLEIQNFSADFGEVGAGNTVTINWNVLGASSSPGGIVISGGIGDVSSNFTGQATVTLGKNASYTFTLRAHNGYVADQLQSITIKTLAGAPTDWNLIQRFDALFGNTSQGINGNGWVGETNDYAGLIDRFNVVTVNSNKVLSPRSGYLVDTNSVPFRYDTPGAFAYGLLNSWGIEPFQMRTLFFRFSLRDPGSLAAAYHIYSGLDFKLGLTDYRFLPFPLAGANPPNNLNGGPGIHISRYDPIGYGQVPFDLLADNYSGSNIINSYSYLADATNGSASGLQLNVNYMAWLDVSNDNTHLVINPGVTTNTANEPVFGLWLQAQGQAAPVQLFSGYGGDRDWNTGGCWQCVPSTYLDRIFLSVGTENFTNGDYGAFFETNNMIVLDDFYLSTNGYNHTIPRLFQIASIARAATNATINWYSLGSLFQTNTYSVQRKFNLTDPTWTTLTNGLPSGGDFTSYTDKTVGSAPTAFYRITWP